MLSREVFVSTNSITQGEQVASVWEPLFTRFGIHIDFAHRTFIWDSEASLKAHVHCVIVGFSSVSDSHDKKLFHGNDVRIVKNIAPYLIDAPVVFINSRSKPLCNAPEMTTGNRPADGGHLIIEAEDYENFIKKEPNAAAYIKKLTGAVEYINNRDRLKDQSRTKLYIAITRAVYSVAFVDSSKRGIKIEGAIQWE